MKRLTAEKEAYRKLSDIQTDRFLKRQQRVGQYAWLLLIAFGVSFGWLYLDTVIKTTSSKQIAAIQTLPVGEGKEVVLSVTLNDGNVAKYLIKSGNADPSLGSLKDGFSTEPIASWELTRMGTALSMGKQGLPVGVSLSVSDKEPSL
jgi:hypothetical protein